MTPEKSVRQHQLILDYAEQITAQARQICSLEFGGTVAPANDDEKRRLIEVERKLKDQARSTAMNEGFSDQEVHHLMQILGDTAHGF